MSINDLPDDIVERIYRETSEELLRPLSTVGLDHQLFLDRTRTRDPGTFLHRLNYRDLRNQVADREQQINNQIATADAQIANIQNQMQNVAPLAGFAAPLNNLNLAAQLVNHQQERQRRVNERSAIATARENYPSMVYFKIMMDRRQ